jgi:4-hydroxybutyryl-CoA dehydratase/vinylacetyl-CoA-Delta-isomerase
MLCQETGCAQRYLAHDALNALARSARASTTPAAAPSTAPASPPTCACAGRGPVAGHRHDRRQGRPQQAPAPAGQPRHLRARRRAQRPRHRHQRHQGHRHRRALHARVPGHALPQHGPGMPTLPCAARCRWTPRASPSWRARPGRPGDKLEHGAPLFSRRYGQATGVVIFDRVFVPWERVFYAGEWEHSGQPDLQLRHPPPPQLHRRARRLRRPADRRRCADVRGQRLRPRRARPACASRWSS